MPALRTRDTQSRSLEVTTDALQPPTLAIISPTPRTFTFPPTHNLADSPYISPSHSPFEPDQINPLPFNPQCVLSPVMTASPQQLQRTLSPIRESPVSTSPRPSQTKTHHRRKSSTSSTSSDEERRPRKGDSDYIKRPENAFILFRRKCCEDRQAAASEDIHDGRTKKERQADLSKTISQQWRCLTSAERKVWEDKAKERKKEHEAMYPNYVYRPQRSKDKAKGKKNDKADPRGDEASPDVGFVLPTPSQPKGRSASVPTPSPYQAIVLPTVYQAAPSCPTSPSLLPMITQYAAQTGQPENCANNFDFLPDENFIPSSNQMNFEAGLDSEFIRNLLAVSQMTSVSLNNSLSPLTTHGLLPPDLISGSGVTSGSSSPVSSPFTPLAATGQSFTQQPVGSDMPGPRQGDPDVLADIDILQDISPFPWETTSMWPNASENLFGDDFDLNAIPNIDLADKFNENFADSSPPLQFRRSFSHALEGCTYSQETMTSFEEMFSEPNF